MPVSRAGWDQHCKPLRFPSCTCRSAGQHAHFRCKITMATPSAAVATRSFFCTEWLSYWNSIKCHGWVCDQQIYTLLWKATGCVLPCRADGRRRCKQILGQRQFSLVITLVAIWAVSWHFDRSLGRKTAKCSSEKQWQNIYHFQRHAYAQFS